MQEAGYEVYLVATASKEEEIQGINIRALSKPRGRLERFVKSSSDVLRKALQSDSAIFHFHDPELIPIAIFLKIVGKKVIYDAHEDVPRQILSKHWIKKPLRRTVAWFVEKIENFSAKRFDFVVAATPFIRNRFLTLGCNAIDINNYPVLSEFSSVDLNWAEKDRTVCYAGVISEARCIFEMVEAVGKAGVRLLLAGQFSEKSQREKAKEMAGWSHVTELGQVDRIDVGKVLGRSMAGLVLFLPEPNHVNSQPNKLFEYMSAGIPVIASNFPLWRRIVEGHHCGICVDPTKPSEIADAIGWILDHSDEARLMGQNGRRAIEEKYNWDIERNKLLKVYEKILN